uniref:Uncharacterized protein n=1 Tax=Amphimedon queenslandica TaxID=400682 RepID=A0A1X7VJQ3_AMPQE
MNHHPRRQYCIFKMFYHKTNSSNKAQQ